MPEAPENFDAGNDELIGATFASPVDLLVESPSTPDYISESQVISAASPATTLYRAATAEYDLQPLNDGLLTDGQADDLLADILAESPLTIRL